MKSLWNKSCAKKSMEIMSDHFLFLFLCQGRWNYHHQMIIPAKFTIRRKVFIFQKEDSLCIKVQLMLQLMCLFNWVCKPVMEWIDALHRSKLAIILLGSKYCNTEHDLVKWQIETQRVIKKEISFLYCIFDNF